MFKNKLVGIALLGLAVGAACGNASATTYGDIAAPGVYFGSGNVNGNFTIDNSNGIELALRAKTYGGALIDGSTGTYQANTGLSALRTSSQTPRLDWNYEFSINSTGANQPLSAYKFVLSVDSDPTSGTSFTTVDPVTYFRDNPTVANGTQNSENGIFPNTPGGMIDPRVSGLYNFDLAAYSLDGETLLARTDIVVRVGNPNSKIPEPESIALLGLGFAGLMAARRRKA